MGTDGIVKSLGVCLVFLALTSCRDKGVVAPPQQQSSAVISSDSAFFALITQSQPFSAYTLFPNADSVTSGTLNGSTAHRVLVRVSMNAVAFAALQNGRLPAGGAFPEGSVIFKEIRNSSGATTLYAVIYKERSNPLAESRSGWLWA